MHVLYLHLGDLKNKDKELHQLQLTNERNERRIKELLQQLYATTQQTELKQINEMSQRCQEAEEKLLLKQQNNAIG